MTHEELLKEGWEPDIGAEGFYCELCGCFMGRYQKDIEDGPPELCYTEGYESWTKGVCPGCGQKHIWKDDMGIELTTDQKDLLLNKE